MTSLGRILVVDDEPKIRSFIGRALASAGYATDFAGSGSDGVRAGLASRYDLVILDLVMPDLDGRQVLGKLLAARPDQAVIVLSCVADVAAKVDLLEHGPQHYLPTPSSRPARPPGARARRRHAGPRLSPPLAPPRASRLPAPAADAEVLRAGDVTLDVGRLVADVGHGPVPLTRLEFLLLRELAEHTGVAVSKERLLASVWGYDFDPGSNLVDVCVRRLRSKLGFELIKTVRGEGYQLAAR